jgi:hypothetical protein
MKRLVNMRGARTFSCKDGAGLGDFFAFLVLEPPKQEAVLNLKGGFDPYFFSESGLPSHWLSSFEKARQNAGPSCTP